ncbi:MAG: PEP-utilizing enzyme [Proteobacteria bacterium]|nr:PEP-utilizing enzyme [Pseudomonadota bacterium]
METKLVQHDQFSEEYISDLEGRRSRANVLARYLNGKAIHGAAAASGVAMGRAVVIKKDEDILKVKDGMVIVSRTASPKLAIILSKANAIATENGGQASNAVEFARIYGIPAVIGISGLTEIIRDGDIIRVDGTQGTIEIKEGMTLNN